MQVFKIVHLRGSYYHKGTLESAAASCFSREFRVYDRQGRLLMQALGRNVEVYEYVNGECVGTY